MDTSGGLCLRIRMAPFDHGRMGNPEIRGW
jgi:hypothetical protein